MKFLPNLVLLSFKLHFHFVCTIIFQTTLYNYQWHLDSCSISVFASMFNFSLCFYSITIQNETSSPKSVHLLSKPNFEKVHYHSFLPSAFLFSFLFVLFSLIIFWAKVVGTSLKVRPCKCICSRMVGNMQCVVDATF